jgi:hypothetical protein
MICPNKFRPTRDGCRRVFVGAEGSPANLFAQVIATVYSNCHNLLAGWHRSLSPCEPLSGAVIFCGQLGMDAQLSLAGTGNVTSRRPKKWLWSEGTPLSNNEVVNPGTRGSQEGDACTSPSCRLAGRFRPIHQNNNSILQDSHPNITDHTNHLQLFSSAGRNRHLLSSRANKFGGAALPAGSTPQNVSNVCLNNFHSAQNT